MTETDPRCDAPRTQGSETLRCVLALGHAVADDPVWHEAIVTDHREMDFGTSHIQVDTREVITWEPLRKTIERTANAMREGKQ